MKDRRTTPRDRNLRRARAAALALAAVVGSLAVPVPAQCQALTPMLLGLTMLLLIDRRHLSPELARVKA